MRADMTADMETVIEADVRAGPEARSFAAGPLQCPF
jgi:hypothetical protein